MWALVARTGIVAYHLMIHLSRWDVRRVILPPTEQDQAGNIHVRVRPKPEPPVSRLGKDRAGRQWVWEAELVRRERGVGRG